MFSNQSCNVIYLHENILNLMTFIQMEPLSPVLMAHEACFLVNSRNPILKYLNDSNKIQITLVLFCND